MLRCLPTRELEYMDIYTLCSYIPEEILMALGCNPIRIMGNANPIKTANAYLPSNVCSFARNIFDFIYERRELSSVYIFANSCHAMESIYEIVRDITKDSKVYMLDVPREKTELSVEYYFKSLQKLIKQIESETNMTFDESEFISAINLTNKKKRVRNDIEERIANCEIQIPTRAYRKLVESYNQDTNGFINSIEKLYESKSSVLSKPRIMLSGSVYAPFDIGEIIEENEADVVVYDYCDGIRQCRQQIDVGDNPIADVAASYLEKDVCARHNSIEERMSSVLKYIEIYKVDAVVLTAIKFCTDQSYGLITISELLKERGIPVLFLDLEYTRKCSGQLITRIQTFIEQIEMAKCKTGSQEFNNEYFRA